MPDPATPFDTQIAEMRLKIQRAQFEGEYRSAKEQLYILEHHRHLYIQQLTRPVYMYMQHDWWPRDVDPKNSVKNITLNYIPNTAKIVFDSEAQIIESDPQQDDDLTQEEHTAMAETYSASNEKRETRPFYERMHETPSANHLMHVANYLHHSIRQVYSFNFEAAKSLAQLANDDAKLRLATMIKAVWSNSEIETAHFEVRKRYNNGTFFSSGKRKGRPPGKKDSYQRTRSASEASKELDAITGGIIGVTVTPPAAETQQPATQPTINNGITEADLQRVVAALGVSLKEYIDKGDSANSLALLDLERSFEKLSTQVASIVEQRPTVVELKVHDLPEVKLGLQHKCFPELLQMCNSRLADGSRLNIWVYGPAGTGKTTAAVNVAKALNLPFHYNGALETKYELTGFIDANGKVVSTAFRNAWINGGIYLFDEIDASLSGALLALNGALANGLASFPDGTFQRHPDCVIIAGANTTGLGGTIEYVGRYKQDAALTDRFVFLDWPIDEALEDALCANKDWVKSVRAFRRNIVSRGEQFKGVMITPRATFYGATLLANGIPLDRVIKSVILKGMTETQKKIVIGG